MNDEQAVRGLLADQVAAMKAGDAVALAGRFTEDAVGFDLAPPLAHGSAELRDPSGLVAWFATFDGPVDYEMRDVVVTVGGDVAFSHSVNRMSATPAGTTDRFDLWFRSTTCFRKVDGRWRVAHEHSSTPFYMDGSMRAAVDLLP
ncbi:MAG TPA: SgcJ/EcaC family oxidoreductase [Pseudonocardiaceae bacterium]|nr:SgcJ/EcaC family oxidoreductase [Pseudonocardiaceae bacterium]